MTERVTESIDQLQAMRREIERRLKSARDAEAARQAAERATQQLVSSSKK